MREILLFSWLCLFVCNDACRDEEDTASCLFTNNINEVLLPTLANGYIGTVVFSDSVHVGGVYNGRANVKNESFYERNNIERHRNKRLHYGGHNVKRDKNKKFRRYSTEFDKTTSHTHRARIPSTVNINFTVKSCSNKTVDGKRTYALDSRHGILYQWFKTHDRSVSVEQRIYVHRRRRNIVVNELDVETSGGFVIALQQNKGEASKDIHFETFSDDEYNLWVGEVNETEVEGLKMTKLAVVSSKVPKRVTVRNSKITLRFITSIVTNLEADLFEQEAVRIWVEALNEGHKLILEHCHEWDNLLSSANVKILEEKQNLTYEILQKSNKGNRKYLLSGLYLSQVISSAMFYIMSSIREEWVYGTSPGGLAPSNEYLGHVFWDQDLWLSLSLVLLHPQMTRMFLEYRYKRLQQANDIAKKFGFKGAMFPWESAVSGYEVCPESVYGEYEIHIGGDVVLEVRQYFYATGDLAWTCEKGAAIVFEVARFWQSRVAYNETKKRYVINDVMPPDEYHYPVNNSVYTNSVARLSLEFGVELGEVCNTSTPSIWKEIADYMFIPYDGASDFHPEFEGFDRKKDIVKQADTVMINYPLMASMKMSTKVNDLLYYYNITDIDGPAMTQSMFTIGFLEVGMKSKAKETFERNFENVRGPFKVWTEIRGSSSGAVNFVTAVGGFFQSIIYGYAGVRVRRDGLEFNLNLLPSNTEYSLEGVKYKGCELRFTVLEKGGEVTLLRSSATELLLVRDDGKIILLVLKVPIFVNRGMIKKRLNL